IKNCRGSRLFKGCSPLQPLCTLIGNCPAIGNFSYRHRLGTILGNCSVDKFVVNNGIVFLILDEKPLILKIKKWT
ncbi:MAG: hypothetical protein JXC36_00585, partial [Candidatus Atribacteria bacterium]|nr:hypothetical protein [Candidatus Atribacteria bacterium]